jgi:hypothetical protein
LSESVEQLTEMELERVQQHGICHAENAALAP